MGDKTIGLTIIEDCLKIVADVAIDNEGWFCDLDAEVGGADFGTSLATGFRAILHDFEQIDRSDIGTFLVNSGMIFATTVGGTSGPVWGTALMRAGKTAKGKSTLTLSDLTAMGNNAIQGIMARGGVAAGDKTILDAIIPAVSKIEEFSKSAISDPLMALHAASEAATASVEKTRQWSARKGQGAFLGERSIGTLDPGIVAFASMVQAIVAHLEDRMACEH